MPRPKDLQILPGMTANVVVNLSGIVAIGKTRYLVPANAVVADSQLDPRVCLVDPQTMTLKPRGVKVGRMRGRDIEVLDSGSVRYRAHDQESAGAGRRRSQGGHRATSGKSSMSITRAPGLPNWVFRLTR